MVMTKHEVLSLLRSGDAPISGQKIAERLHISRTAVWKAVDALRKEGYEIASRQKEGYRLISATSHLSEEEIRHHLSGHPWQDSVAVIAQVESTNDLVKQLASAGAPEGTCIVTEAQSKGRGRLGRSFHSPEGMGIYFSVLLRPDVLPAQVMHLTAAAALAIADAIEEETGLCADIKWVNDLMANGKKLCGILTELFVEMESGRAEYIVVGVGLNCCQLPSDFPPEISEIATSLAMQTGKAPDRNALTAAIVRAMYRLKETMLTEQDTIMERYRSRCITLGKPVQILRPTGAKPAFALDCDREAALLVEYPDGARAKISSGEVTIRPL